MRKRFFNPGSIRFRFFAFLVMLLLILLLLLNIYPYVSVRDAVYQEKEKSMESRAATLASALSGLDRPDAESVAEVLRLLEFQGYDRVTVTDSEGRSLYDLGSGADASADVRSALGGKTIFRSSLRGDSFQSSYVMPVSSQGQITGAVYLFEQDVERGQIFRSLQLQIRTVSLVIAAAAMLLALLYSEVVLRKFRELSDSMRIVAEGDYSHRMTSTGRDELAELGAEFNALTERLQDTERQRRRFVSDASHELKTPLASIRLLSDSIVQNENIDPDTVREFVSDIGNEAERLQRTTEKLLDLSRLDDDIQVVPEPVDVKQVALDALVFLRPLAEERKVHMHAVLDDGCVVLATVDDMFHIVFNLMENAVKYNVPEGRVEILLHADEDSDTVVFTVEDTGIGIPEEERFNIFSRFYRVDKARSREAGGSGLGLSIVHDAVKAHGGSIAVGANKPQGSRFIVSFPRTSIERT